MPYKQNYSLENNNLYKAAENRIKESEKNLKEIQLKAESYLKNTFSNFELPVQSGNVISSDLWSGFLKDEKFYTEYLNRNSSMLENEIKSVSSNTTNLINDFNTEIKSLNSEITEAEIKKLEGSNFVHFNNFNRSIDQNVEVNFNEWNYDFKTGNRFLINQLCNTIPGLGVTLPVQSKTFINIDSIELISEESDSGDSGKPLLATSPMNLLIDDKVFKYVIIRKENDSTSRKYVRTESRVSLLINFSYPQTVNSLEIKSVAQSDLNIDSISYLNPLGEELDIALIGDSNSGLLFTPVFAKAIKLVIKQYAPIDRTSFSVRDIKISQLNELLKGIGFDLQLPANEETISGRIFDFSLDSIKAYLINYQGVGLFRSHKLELENPLGFSLIKTLNLITSNNSNYSFSSLNNYLEGYLGLNLNSYSGKSIINELIPVPDSYNTQEEILILNNENSKVKLFPDFNWGTNHRLVESVYEDDFHVVIVLDRPHGLVPGTYNVNFITPVENFLSGVKFAKIIEANSFRITPEATFEEYKALKNIKVILPSFFNTIEVKKDNTVLSIGTDYLVSIDAGKTWHNQIPYTQAERITNPTAGDFRVRFLNLDTSKIYTIKYKVLPNQNLTSTGLVKLVNGRVLTAKKLRVSKGTVQAVFVLRTSSYNNYYSPVINNYTLRVE